MSADAIVVEAVALGDDDRIRAILQELCDLTGMGFVAVARVTEERWIACQVLDQIEFGMTPGGELEVSTTICDDIRKTSTGVVIDHVDMDHDWRRHPTPTLYGFQSYVSLPLTLDDGSFFGTLCAIDPKPRKISAPELVAQFEALAARVVAILAQKGAKS